MEKLDLIFGKMITEAKTEKIVSRETILAELESKISRQTPIYRVKSLNSQSQKNTI